MRSASRRSNRGSTGTFDTAVEAAVASARHVGAPEEAGEEDEEEEEEEEEEAAEVVLEADGLRLHPSTNSSGYRGV